MDVPIYPSKADGALARFGSMHKNSRHYAEDRLSDALDLFVDKRKSPLEVLITFLSVHKFGGIGVYFDTKNNRGEKHIMFHVDMRPVGMNHVRRSTLIWYRENGNYFYPQYQNFDEFLRKM